MKNLLLFVIASVLLQQAIANEIIPENGVCPLNQVYTECGSACAPTCDTYKTPPQFCTMQCIVGCVCQNGYVKKSDGSCCLPEECSEEEVTQPSCSLAHEAYTDCGSACPKTCDNIDVEMMCMDVCVQGCFCEEGYVRKGDGSCCLPQECEPEIYTQSCPLHQVYNSCGTACPLTCENYENPPRFCTKNCVIGCVCEAGYVKKSDGSCCLPKDCKPKKATGLLNAITRLLKNLLNSSKHHSRDRNND